MVETAKLQTPFHLLGMAKPFIDQAEKLGLSNLEDILNVNIAQLKASANFSFIWYAEMLDLLKAQGLLQEFQGKHI